MFDFVGVGVLVVLAALFAWLASRAWGSRNAILKWAGLVLSGLLTLVFGFLLVVSLIGFSKLNARYDNPVAEVTVAGTPEQIARGERLAQVCAGCHSPNAQPPLSGQDFGVGGPPMGTIYASNLTPAGELKDWSDGEVIRAIREGVHKNGRSLIIMPSNILRNLSDEDVQAIVAYLRSQPAVEPANPPANLNVIGAILVNVFPAFTRQEPVGSVAAVPEGPTGEYGEYLVSILFCRECHGENLTGGADNGGLGPPPGPNLTQIVPNWTEEQFVTFIRTGVDPEGNNIDPEMMPWEEFSAFATDDDLKAIYAYLHALPPTTAPAQ